ncbi:L-threonine dehydratase catabolic TdcB-like [Amphiura filiformis]|uniref:L-threonine dehydratase catabolic TdcB-like n=1 Tax=Amphiura filiformis TaxID=82378 RepID=UPI003B20F225
MAYNPDAPLATLADLQLAYQVVRKSPLCVRTPMLHHVQDRMEMKEDMDLHLKLENMQITGSFKVRGLANQLAHIPSSVANKEQSTITMSAGNYGKAYAFATNQLGLKAMCLMPETAPENRAKVLQGFGVCVEKLPTPELQVRVDQYCEEKGMHYLHPFDDINLITGHGSCGLEMLEEVPDPDIVIVCCGGGGLVAGIAAAVKLTGQCSSTRVYGVEPEGANTMYQSFKAGEAVKDPTVHTIAAGLAPPMAGSNTYKHCHAFVEDIILVSDEEILDAVAFLYKAGLVVEPSGAAAFAALRSSKIPDVKGKRVVAVITGGNVTPQELTQLITV